MTNRGWTARTSPGSIADTEVRSMSDIDVVRVALMNQLIPRDEALAALDRIEAENQRHREALERILAAPLRSGRWYREHDNPRLIARLALAANPKEEPATRRTGLAGDKGGTAAD